MHWIQTYSGMRLEFTHPTAAMIALEDIAHGLSNIPRFAGQLDERWTVLEHSMFVATIVKNRLKGTPDESLAVLQALLHDAAEAYMGDIPSPLKSLLPDYTRIENRLLSTIFTAFNLPISLHPEVKIADEIALATEAHWLFAHPPLNREAWLRYSHLSKEHLFAHAGCGKVDFINGVSKCYESYEQKNLTQTATTGKNLTTSTVA